MHTSPLLDQVRTVARIKHLSLRTETAYLNHIKRFIIYHQKQHPAAMREAEIRAYLAHLAVDQQVAASTQNVALCALLFLYREVLQIDLPHIADLERARRSARVPVVFTRSEVQALLDNLHGEYQLMASLLYGSGLRLMECLRLRVKDLDFAYQQLTVRDGKGGKDRVTMLPRSLTDALQHQLAYTRRLHEKDLAEGYGAVYLPYALARKYPNAATEWGWQYLFPAARRSRDPRADLLRRHHVSEDVLQRAVKMAIKRAGIVKAAAVIRCAIRSRHICLKMAMISEPSNSYSVIRICGPPCCTRTF